ncbi:MAG: hypothetical protein HDR74_03550 [Bacteroides sp.]|nr:hypothetical protein [Bacteroides sp.]MDE5810342.1 hypothetical protein [Muribaculaceae bacterium]
MLLTLTYEELSKLIENQTGKSLKFNRVDSSTVNITTSINLSLFNYNPEIKIKIVEIKGVLLTLEYTGNRFINLIGKTVIKRIQAKQTEPYMIGGNNRLITINMGLIPKLKELLPIIDIRAIYFNVNHISVEGNVVE